MGSHPRSHGCDVSPLVNFFFFTGNGLVTKVFEVTISIFASSNFNFSLAGSTTYALRMQCICGWAVQRMYHISNFGSLFY